MTSAIGIDVGGTSIKAGVVDAAGQLTGDLVRPTPRESDAVVDAVAAIAAELGAAAGADGPVGVVVPGVVDERAGVAVWSENLRWRDVPFRAELEDRLGCSVAVGHDVRAGGLAEHRVGASRTARSSAFVPIGTGIAAALILDGRPYAGDGFAGEIGHVDVGHDLACACEGYGCLEAIASAAAIARRYTEATGVAVDGAQDVAGRVRAGEAAAIAVWDDALDALARALATLVSIVAPEVVVIGGGLVSSSDLLIDPVRQRLAERLTFQRMPQVMRAELGEWAGCIGAGLLAMDPVAAS